MQGLTAWDVAPTTVKQAYANDLFSQVACGEKSRVMVLLEVSVGAPPYVQPTSFCSNASPNSHATVRTAVGAIVQHRGLLYRRGPLYSKHGATVQQLSLIHI